ncbi:hypothetical protein CEXT_452261, partial [Caerostris extrusa]
MDERKPLAQNGRNKKSKKNRTRSIPVREKEEAKTQALLFLLFFFPVFLSSHFRVDQRMLGSFG